MDLHNPGIEHGFPTLQADSLHLNYQGSPNKHIICFKHEMVGHQEDNSYRHYGSKLGVGKENKKGFLIQRSFEIHLGRLI